MKYTEGAFRDWAYNVVTSEYSGKVLNDGTYLIEQNNMLYQCRWRTGSVMQE